MRNTYSSLVYALLCLVISHFTVTAHAGQASAGFQVTVRLNAQQPTSQAGVCISTVLGQQTGAVVRVVCSTGQVVSIEAAPGTSVIAGVHGGAFRYSFGAGTLLAPGAGLTDSELGFIGLGTITAMRIVDLTGRKERLEFLVSF
jgi:hypothetical protein